MESYKPILPKEYTDIHKDDECFCVAEINLEQFIDEEEFNEEVIAYVKLQPYGICKIQMYSNEGPIPHFHIENKNKSFICCIRLDKPEYFKHGFKTGDLNNKQIKELIKVLNEKPEKDEMTNFEAMCFYWNRDVSIKGPKLKKPYTMPDYTKLNK